MANVEIEVEKIDNLRKAFDVLVTKPEALNVGDIVILHPDVPGGFKFPNEEEPAIFLEWLPRPFYGYELTGDPLRLLGTPQGAMRFDCVILVHDDDGDTIPFLMDSRKLKKVG